MGVRRQSRAVLLLLPLQQLQPSLWSSRPRLRSRQCTSCCALSLLWTLPLRPQAKGEQEEEEEEAAEQQLQLQQLWPQRQLLLQCQLQLLRAWLLWLLQRAPSELLP